MEPRVGPDAAASLLLLIGCLMRLPVLSMVVGLTEKGACPLSTAGFGFGAPSSDGGTELSLRLFWVNFPVNAAVVFVARGLL